MKAVRALMHLTAALCTAVSLRAQPAPVNLDLAGRKVKEVLPFGEDLSIRGTIPKETRFVMVRIGYDSLPGNGTDIDALVGCGLWTRDPIELRAPATEFRIDLPQNATLRPGKRYIIETLLLEPEPTSIPLIGCGSLQSSTYKVTDSVSIRARTDYDPKSRFNTDIGIIRTYRMGYTGATSNVQFSVVPLNPKEDLANPRLTLREHFLRRFTISAGVSVKQLSSQEEVVMSTPIGSLLAGVAVRSLLYNPRMRKVRWLMEPMRVGANVIWLKQQSAHPLIDEKISKVDVGAQVGFDVPLQQLLSPLLGLLK